MMMMRFTTTPNLNQSLESLTFSGYETKNKITYYYFLFWFGMYISYLYTKYTCIHVHFTIIQSYLHQYTHSIKYCASVVKT